MAKGIDRGEVRRSSRLEDVIPALSGQQLHAANGRAEPLVVCPFHEDKHPSLRINLEKQVWRCDPCNIGGDVFTFGERFQRTDFPGALHWLARRAGIEVEQSRVVATFDYHDVDGRVIYQSRRFEPGPNGRKKTFKQRRPDGRGGWINNMKGVTPLPYELHKLKDIPEVFIAEGEAKAARLWSLGVPATCNVGGAGKWGDEESKQLQAVGVKRVAILPDNDAAGQTGAESTARCCHAAGLQVQIVELLGLPPKGDIIDWLDAGGTRDELLKLTKAAPLFSPAAHETAERPSAKWEVTPRRTFQQPPQQGRSVDVLFEDLELWPDAVHLAQLLDEIHGVVTRYVILPDGAADAVTLWIAFTYLMDVWHVAPNLMATSPTKQCGKTRLLQVVRGLVYRALTCSSVTGPALFRVIEKYGPTLLIDEAENALTDKHNDVYALLNAGHTRDTAIAIRTVGEKQHEPAVFSTWAPKMFTLIGRLRDTVMDRSINIEMRRRAAGEVVAPMRAAAFAEVCCPLRRKLLRWSEDARERAAAIEPTFPEGLRDRAQDNWSALLVIAQLAGPAWVERAHAAAVLLSGGEEANDDSLGVQLLADCRAIHAREGGDAIASKRLVELLTDIEDRPYADARGGKGISQAWLAGQLKRWKIVSAGTVRFGATTAKGYRWASFRDAWSRYLPSPQNECDGSSVVGDAPCDGSGPQNRPINTEGCYGVTAVTALRGEEEEAAADGLF